VYPRSRRSREVRTVVGGRVTVPRNLSNGSALLNQAEVLPMLATSSGTMWGTHGERA
jgi:hypothetical protein